MTIPVKTIRNVYLEIFEANQECSHPLTLDDLFDIATENVTENVSRTMLYRINRIYRHGNDTDIDDLLNGHRSLSKIEKDLGKDPHDLFVNPEVARLESIENQREQERDQKLKAKHMAVLNACKRGEIESTNIKVMFAYEFINGLKRKGTDSDPDGELYEEMVSRHETDEQQCLKEERKSS